MPAPLTLGILSPLIGNFYFGQLLRGIQQAAEQRGARAIAIQTRDAWALHAEYGRSHDFTHQLAAEYVDGWIAITDAVSLDYLRAVMRAGKPVVALSWRSPDLDCPVVLPDNYGGVQQLMRHLIAHGHTRITFAGFTEHTDIRERYEGYKAALVERGLAPDPDLFIAVADNQALGGRQAAERLLAAGMPCTAIVAGTDLNALALMEVLQGAGLRIPEDIAVAGFDDIASAQYAVPALTTVRQRFDMLGRAAAELLLDKLAGAEIAGDVRRVPCTLIPRRSCGCVPTPSLLLADLDTPRGLGWQAQLAEDLTRLALPPGTPHPGAAPARIWPSATTLVQAAAAAVDGTPGPSSQALADAWRDTVGLTTDLNALRGMVARLHDLPEIPAADTAARERLDQFADTALSDMLHARLRVEVDRSAHFESVILNNYNITAAVLVDAGRNARELDWLRASSAARGCLGLWDSSQTRLVVSGVFDRAGDAPKLADIYSPQRFPPVELLERRAQDADDAMLMLFPVRTPQREWGVLAVAGPVEATLESGRSMFSQATALLAIALEREELLDSLVAQQASLREAYDRESVLAATIREIGAPIIPLLPHVLLIPLVGSVDTARAQHLIEAALHGIGHYQADEVLLDLTGVPLVDTQVASALIQVTQAARLLGAHVTLMGVRPEIAQSLVSLGIDLSFIKSAPTLSSAVEHLVRRRGGMKR